MLHWQQKCFISSLLSVPPMQLASGISALAFLEDHWNCRTQKDPTSLSVYNTCNTVSCQQWCRTSKMHVSFKRTGSHDPHHLHHFQRKGNQGGWLDLLLVSREVWGPRCHIPSPTVFLYNFGDAFVLIAQAEASQVVLREKLSSQ